MNDDTDHLVQSACRGDAQAAARLLEEHLPRLRAFIRLRTGPEIRQKESQSDLVQSVCREVLVDLPNFEYRGEEAFRGWLFQTALRKIVDKHKFYGRAMRDVRRERSMGSETLAACYQTLSSPSQAAVRKEEVARFETIFDQLPADYREVISLAKIAGLNHAEIALQLGRTEGATRVLLHRALARLAVLVDTGG